MSYILFSSPFRTWQAVTGSVFKLENKKLKCRLYIGFKKDANVKNKVKEHLFIADHNRQVFRFEMETTEVNTVNQVSETWKWTWYWNLNCDSAWGFFAGFLVAENCKQKIRVAPNPWMGTLMFLYLDWNK